jgi:hypothetical protein
MTENPNDKTFDQADGLASGEAEPTVTTVLDLTILSQVGGGGAGATVNGWDSTSKSTFGFTTVTDDGGRVPQPG